MSSLLSEMGQLHIVRGTITVNSGTWTLSDNDGSSTLTDLGLGNVRVDFGDAFLSAPTVVATALKATAEAAEAHYVYVEAVTTTTCEFKFYHLPATPDEQDPDDDDGWMFIAIGLRNN